MQTQIIAHRINTLEGLRTLDPKYGVEIDIRGEGGKLLLQHDPIEPTHINKLVDLDDFLKVFAERNMAFVILNVKEDGYEERIIELCTKYGIPKEKYFLLDVEFPFLYRATRKLGIREIAVRFSEAEPIEALEAQIVDGELRVNWLWIDTNTKLPLDEATILRIKKSGAKTALVCPDRWGRPEDIPRYAEQMKNLGFKPDMVMTSVANMQEWEELLK